jgi:transcriptional regulator with XRE-family HTH domain
MMIEEFGDFCKGKRKEAGIKLSELCKQAKLNYAHTRRMELGTIDDYRLDDVISYLSILKVKLFIKYPDEERLIGSNQDIVDWLISITKDTQDRTQVSEMLGYRYTTAKFARVFKESVGLDAFLGIVGKFGGQIELVDNNLKTPGMSRAEFCKRCKEYRLESKIMLKEICEKTGFNYGQIKNIEDGKHSIGMDNIILYLSIFPIKLLLRHEDKIKKINCYKDALKWIINTRKNKFSQYELSRKIGYDGATMNKIENGKNIIRLDAFLRIIEVLGYTIEFTKYEKTEKNQS